MTQEEAGAKVSIIIPTVQGGCVWCSLVMTMLTIGPTAEIILIADQPTEQKLNLLRRFGAIIVANDKRVGAPHAFNQGIKMATRPYLMISNDDIMPVSAEFLVPLVSALDKHPEFGMVAPRVVRPWNEHQVWYAAIAEGSLMSRAMIDKVGMFDEDPDYNGQCADADYYARCKAAGYQFHGIPQAMIIHNSGQTVGRLLTAEYCKKVSEKIKAKWGDLVDQHLLPEYTEVN